MAKQSVIEARKAQAAQAQASATAELSERVAAQQEQIAKLETKIDVLIEALKPKTKAEKAEKGA